MKNLLPVFLLIIAIAGFYFYIKPQYESLLKTQALERQYVEAINKSQELVDLYNQLSEKYNKFSADNLKKLDSVVPQNSNNVRLVMDISDIALGHGILIRAVKTADTTVGGQPSADPNVTQPNASYRETAVSFSFKGSYDDAITFVKDLEKSLRIMDVRSISLLPAKDTGYDFTLSLVAYSISPMN